MVKLRLVSVLPLIWKKGRHLSEDLFTFSGRTTKKIGEVSHGDYIRCPACGSRIVVHDGDSYELLSDGEHEVMCNECEFEFEITTDVTYAFTSPARLEKED